MKRLVLIAHNLRSAHNVGSLLRTADGLGIDEVILTGYTPFPAITDDPRLPHEQRSVQKQIDKTALGAVASQSWRRESAITTVITNLKANGYTVGGLEQSTSSISLPAYDMPDRLAIILGREVEGIEPAVLADCDVCLEIPMFGRKESFNVVQAAAMAGYQWRFLRD